MQRTLFLAFFIIAMNTVEFAAGEKVARLEPFREFVGFPRIEKVGSKGHRTRDSWFTGRWYCAAITWGVKGEPVNIPFAARGLPVKDERVVAITAIDSQSETRLCLRIRPEFQPSWKEFQFRVITKDVICLTARKSSDAGESKDCTFLTVSLSDKTIDVKQMPMESAKLRLQSLAFNPPYDGKPLDEDEPPKDGFSAEQRTLGNGWGSLDEIRIYGDAKHRAFIGPGSRDGRVTECEVIGSGAFAISEREADPKGRQFWLLSEAAIEPQANEKPANVAHLNFPRLLIAPVKTLVFATAPLSGSPTLYGISNGRLRKLWDVPTGYSISPRGLHLSEDESHAAVELSAGPNAAIRDIVVSIKVDTNEVNVFPERTEFAEEFLFVVGVTNRGDLIQENASVADTWQFIVSLR